LPFACVPIMDQLKKMGAKPTLRMAKAKMGPCISDNGNFIVDADFGCISDVEGLSQKLSGIPGVLGHGLFVRMASLVYIGCNTSEEPSVRIIRKE
jgi:ribose 5-phosphate isomerase A